MLPEEHARLILEASRANVTRTLTASLRGQCVLDLDDAIAALRDELDHVRRRHADVLGANARPAAQQHPAPVAHNNNEDSDSDGDRSDGDAAEQSVAVSGLADAAALVAGSPVAVPFRTRRGEAYFAGTVVRMMPRTARVQFPDVDGTSTNYDVDHGRLFAIMASESPP